MTRAWARPTRRAPPAAARAGMGPAPDSDGRLFECRPVQSSMRRGSPTNEFRVGAHANHECGAPRLTGRKRIVGRSRGVGTPKTSKPER